MLFGYRKTLDSCYPVGSCTIHCGIRHPKHGFGKPNSIIVVICGPFRLGCQLLSLHLPQAQATDAGGHRDNRACVVQHGLELGLRFRVWSVGFVGFDPSNL